LSECITEKNKHLLHPAFKPNELLHICVNAKKYVESAKLLSYDAVSTVLKFTYPDGETKNQYVIQCPSTPVFYVYFEDIKSSINVLYQENASPTDQSQS